MAHVSRFFCSQTSHDSLEQEPLPGLGFATTALSNVSCFSQTTCKVHVSAGWWFPCWKERTLHTPSRPVPLPTGHIKYWHAGERQLPPTFPGTTGTGRRAGHWDPPRRRRVKRQAAVLQRLFSWNPTKRITLSLSPFTLEVRRLNLEEHFSTVIGELKFDFYKVK